MRRRSVGIVVFDGVQGLDVHGPADAFYFAGYALGDETAYAVELVGREVGPLATAGGPRLHVDRTIDDPALRPDLLLVAGGRSALTAAEDEVFVGHLADLAARSGEVGSICSGALLLAETGLLDDRQATTHWALADELRRRRPKVDVESNLIFIRDGAWTSAGVTAGIDLSIELVRLHHGAEIATEVAKNMVVYLQRAGGQDQFSSHLAVRQSTNPTVTDLLAHIADHLDEDLTVPALAAHARMSERSLQRVFSKETGTSPGRYVERCRVEEARRLLELGDDGLAGVARRCGFGTAETLIRSFVRVVEITPAEYRARFSRPAGHGV